MNGKEKRRKGEKTIKLEVKKKNRNVSFLRLSYLFLTFSIYLFVFSQSSFPNKLYFDPYNTNFYDLRPLEIMLKVGGNVSFSSSMINQNYIVNPIISSNPKFSMMQSDIQLKLGIPLPKGIRKPKTEIFDSLSLSLSLGAQFINFQVNYPGYPNASLIIPSISLPLNFQKSIKNVLLLWSMYPELLFSRGPSNEISIFRHSYGADIGFQINKGMLNYFAGTDFKFNFDNSIKFLPIYSSFRSNYISVSLIFGVGGELKVKHLKNTFLSFLLSPKINYILDKREFLQNPIFLSPALRISPYKYSSIDIFVDISLLGSKKENKVEHKVAPPFTFGAKLYFLLLPGGITGLKRIKGVILDDNLNPIEGAVVALPDGRAAISSLDGSFFIDIPQDIDEISISAFKNEYEKVFSTIPAVENKTIKIILKKIEMIGSIRGEVKSSEGEPVFAKVRVEETGETFNVDAGVVDLKLKPGKYTLVFSAEGFEQEKIFVNVSAGQKTTLSVVLRKKEIEDEEEKEIYIDEINREIVLKQPIEIDKKGNIAPSSYIQLIKLAKFIMENNLKVLVLAYSPRTMKKQEQYKISADIAQKITEYLISRGVRRDRIFPKGMGPVPEGETPDIFKVIFKILED